MASPNGHLVCSGTPAEHDLKDTDYFSFRPTIHINQLVTTEHYPVPIKAHEDRIDATVCHVEQVSLRSPAKVKVDGVYGTFRSAVGKHVFERSRQVSTTVDRSRESQDAVEICGTVIRHKRAHGSATQSLLRKMKENQLETFDRIDRSAILTTETKARLYDTHKSHASTDWIERLNLADKDIAELFDFAKIPIRNPQGMWSILKGAEFWSKKPELNACTDQHTHPMNTTVLRKPMPSKPVEHKLSSLDALRATLHRRRTELGEAAGRRWHHVWRDTATDDALTPFTTIDLDDDSGASDDWRTKQPPYAWKELKFSSVRQKEELPRWKQALSRLFTERE
ncbi:uncharacterized protein V1518DRAFT_427556 [Limtongia smithiae]|uniref:uncharacterized protein n=1 Tax=Limtongia smithiae TaxID=1125753 RepID=UPI0034CF0AC2